MNSSNGSNALDRIQSGREYQKARADKWATWPQFDWFIRSNRARLVKAGALLMFRGAWHVDPDLFEPEAVAIARDDAQRWLDRETGKTAA